MKMNVTSCPPDRYDLPNVQVQVIQLCDKHSCHCFIECSPIHIDCSTNRQHKSGDPLVHLVLFFNTAESDRQGCRTVWLKRMEFMAQVCSCPVPAWRDSSVPKSKPRAQSMLALWQVQEPVKAVLATVPSYTRPPSMPRGQENPQYSQEVCSRTRAENMEFSLI